MREVKDSVNGSNQFPIMLSMAHLAYIDLWEVEVISGFTKEKSINHDTSFKKRKRVSLVILTCFPSDNT
jgi:hypothetical protein